METVVTKNRNRDKVILNSAPMEGIKIDGFMGEYLQRAVDITIPSQYEMLEQTGRIDNFRVCSGKSGKHKGYIFNDSDVYKWLEAASYAMLFSKNNRLKGLLSKLVDEIAAAQSPDGYINTFYCGKESERWSNLAANHEMYCLGHLISAGITNYRATGKKKLFHVALKAAKHLVKMFGAKESPATPGHPAIEMALVELYRETEDKRYLDLAVKLIERRGKGALGGSEYLIDHKSFVELREVTGHAVRMLYLCSGAADVYSELGNESLLKTLELLWDNMTGRKISVTGGVGARHEGEAFGEDFELFSHTAYNETCAAIASFMWNWRMFLISGNSKYVDLMEKTLYNAILVGISFDGKRYFYDNPLENRGDHRRQEWFDCACCPTNIIRILTSFPGYIYSISEKDIWVNFFENGEAILPFGESFVKISQITNYPWSGKVNFEVETEIEKAFSIYLRIPEWAKEGFTITVNSEEIEPVIEKGYARIKGVWKGKRYIEMDLMMKINPVVANPMVRENVGKIAITFGPIVYCAEGNDNPGVADIWNLFVNRREGPKIEYIPNLFGGINVIKGKGKALKTENWDKKLYKSYEKNEYIETSYKLIPYFLWANRDESPMCIWLNSF